MSESTKRSAPAIAEATFRLELSSPPEATGLLKEDLRPEGPSLARTPVRLPPPQPPTAVLEEPPARPFVPPPPLLTQPTPPPSGRSRARKAAPTAELPAPPSPTGRLEISVELARLIPHDTARALRVFPFHRQQAWLWVATDRTNRAEVARAIGQLTGLSTIVGEAPYEVVQAVLKGMYGSGRPKPMWLSIEPVANEQERPVHHPGSWAGFQTSQQVRGLVGDILALGRQSEHRPLIPEDEAEAADQGSLASQLVDRLIWLAVLVEASDLHLEPNADDVQVRLRLDGVLQPLAQLPRRALAPMVGRLKVLASMNLVERRMPQEARFRWLSDHLERDRRIDVRVSTMPMVYGEGVVLRVLDTAHLRTQASDLGLSGDDLVRVKRCMQSPRGLVLTTGPTGSGKTTTLYTLATELNSPSRKIVTVEDPVEYYLPGLQQTQVNTGVGLTFDRIIRSMLRQDPDVILVGEIRDRETAESAVKAALTGHLVLSSLHTGDAAGAVSRLIDLGVEPSLCAAAVRMVVAQRLLRTLCPNCRKPVDADQVYPLLSLADVDPSLAEVSYQPGGCAECRNIGYHGRQAIFEVLDVTSPRLRKLIAAGSSADALRKAAEEEGMTTLAAAALGLVRNGETSIEEALRVVWLD